MSHFLYVEKSRRPEVYSELKEPEDVAVYAKGSQLAVADTGRYIINIFDFCNNF